MNMMTKIVNINSNNITKINGMKVRGFISKIELPVSEIRRIIAEGASVYEIVPGMKPIMLTLNNYDKEFKPIKTVDKDEKIKTDFFIRNDKTKEKKVEEIKTVIQNNTELKETDNKK